MDYRSSAVALLAAVAVAACSPDVTAPLMAPKSVSLSQSVGHAGRHIVLVDGDVDAASFAARVAAFGGNVASYHEGARFGIVSGLSAAAAADLASSGIGSVQADVQVSLDFPNAAIQADASDVLNAEVTSQAAPATAILHSWQWGMQLIRAPTAWAANKLGSSAVTVAILDTGLDYNNRDLNTLVDLSRSVSFMSKFRGVEDDPLTPEDEYTPIVPSDDAIIGAFFPTRHKITDLHGHGTNVASQVSSMAFAFAGVTSKTTLIGVKVLGANGYGDLGDILSGVLWAADHGADVANMSLGGAFAKSGNGWFVGAINRVFNYARQKGMLIVVSAGNSRADFQHNRNTYATYCDAPHVICVSAVGPTTPTGNPDQAAVYTNFGRGSVDIAAPGGNAGNVQSRWPWSGAVLTDQDRASYVWGFCARQRLAIVLNKDEINGDLFFAGCQSGGVVTGYVGTSQAAPHVSGLAALLIAEHGKGKPGAIKKLIQVSADPINPALGRGRINVKTALGL